MDQWPPGRILQGKEYMMPSGMPYWFPSLITAMLVYLSPMVPYQRSCTWSQAAAAAEAADDFPIT